MSTRSALVIAILVVPFACSLAAAGIGRGSHEATVAVFRLGTAVACVSALAAALLVLRRRRAAAFACLTVVASILSIVGAYAAGRAAVAVDTKHLTRSAEALLPAIRDYHRKHGQYPSSLAAVGVGAVSRGACALAYKPRTTSFEFYILDPWLPWRSYEWYSGDPIWREVYRPGIW